MCGITGHINFNHNKILSKGTLKSMIQKMDHRGPDNSGFFIDDNVQFGMTRLSIIDKDTGNQPIISDDGNLILIMNGEIYNYKSLRLDLEKDGYNFRTKSDTEVLMNLYKKYNYDCIRHIKGMFAFCLYDKSKNIIWISRDRYGIKPLYYCIDNHSLIFGSSLDSIISSNIIKPNLSKNSINLYLFLSFVPTPYTIYENIYKLKPGHEIIFSVNDFKINKYWNEDRVEYYSDTADSLDKLLDLSVQEHSVSDRPIGTFLSGGLDSTLITLKYSKHFKDFHCYTAISKMINQSDKKFSDLVTNSLNLKHTKIDIDNIQNMDIMDELINFIDEPVYDSSMLPTYLISKVAKQQGIDVLLAGNGADEIFGGYSRHYKKYRDKARGFLKSISLNFLIKLSNIIPINMHKLLQLKYKYIGYSIGYSGNYMNNYELLGEKELDNIENCLEEYFTVQSKPRITDFFSNMKYVDQKCYLVDNGLSILDKCTMAASVEGRVPFLDHHFFVSGDRYSKNHTSTFRDSKKFIRDILANSNLGFMAKRDKEGFNVSHNNIVELDHNIKYIKSVIYDAGSILEQYFNFSITSKMFDDVNRYKENIMALYVLSKWIVSRRDVL